MRGVYSGNVRFATGGAGQPALFRHGNADMLSGFTVLESADGQRRDKFRGGVTAKRIR